MSWHSGEVPSDWKKENLASIFKKGEKRTLGTTDLLVSSLLLGRSWSNPPRSCAKVLGGPGGDSRQPAWHHQGQPA